MSEEIVCNLLGKGEAEFAELLEARASDIHVMTGKVRPSTGGERIPAMFENPLAAVLALIALIGASQWFAPDAFAAPYEATPFSVPAGSPDEDMQAGADFARELYPQVEISYWEAEAGSLSVSRVERDGIRCLLRLSPLAGEALRPLGRFLNGRLDLRAQVMFATAHEVGHCKLREAFLKRSDGRAADASAFPWLAQEAAADAYGILSAERKLGAKVPVGQAVVLSRMLASSAYRDPNHATGHYVSEALALCPQNRSDADAVQCAVAVAYFTVGSLANDEQGSPYPVDSEPQLIYDLGVRQMAERIRVYRDIAEYKARFAGADLGRFEFNEISRHGESLYLTAASGPETDATYRLADYYGFKTGELATDGSRNVTALRIDGPDELDWLLTLGAVVRTEDGRSLSKRTDSH
jgi:hypothetical protein